MKLPTWHLLLWMLLGWSIPAVLAHAIGWHAIWGSGSVALDYLLPIPVAAGVLHVPSFVLCTIGLWQLPTVSAKTSGRLRAAAWGLALAGGLGLLRLDEALIAVRSGGAWSGTLWQENPLALFVLTDAALALLMSVGRTVDAPGGRDPVRWLLWLCPGLGVLVLAWQMAPAADAFLPGAVRPGLARGDEQWMVYTGQDIKAPGFQPKATIWAQQRHRSGLGLGGDMAILFSQSRDAVKRSDMERAQLTLCLFDDDTPPRWLPGAQSLACFDGHQNFSEEVDIAIASQATDLPIDKRHANAQRQVCSERGRRTSTTQAYGPCAAPILP